MQARRPSHLMVWVESMETNNQSFMFNFYIYALFSFIVVFFFDILCFCKQK